MKPQSDTPKQSHNPRNTRHGHARTWSVGRTTPTYRSWMSMKQRILRPQARHVTTYAGITICDRWMRFENFLADLGERPAGTTLDRIDNSKGYEPGNCRWADWKTQGSNRGCVIPITFNGKTQNPEDWARELGLKPQTIRRRLDRGWPLERVMSPSRPRKAHTPLSRPVVLEIKARLAKGEKPVPIAKAYGVRVAAIYEIAAGRTWRNV